VKTPFQRFSICSIGVEDVLEREPYAPDVEHPSRRCYVLARAPDDRVEDPMQ